MKLVLFTQRHKHASALLTVMLLGAIAIVVLSSTMLWTSNNAQLTERNIQYFDAVAAAEAATEKALTGLSSDFARIGISVLSSAKLPKYRNGIPTSQEYSRWGKYKFSNGKGDDDEVFVDMISPWNNSPLISQYAGLSGYAATFRIRANAQDLTSNRGVVAAVQQDVQIALVPLFQFAIFYNMDMEVNPGPTMNITGRVHGNDNIYLQPGAPLTFLKDVTSTEKIILDKKPGDPLIRIPSTVTFKGEHDNGAMSLNLPIGSDNSPEAVHKIIEIPPNNESPNSALGLQRFYNTSDLVLIVNGDNDVTARGGGLGNGNGVKLKWSDISGFIDTGVSFKDWREGKTIKATQIDVAKLKAWSEDKDNNFTKALGEDVKSIYIADLRPQASDTEPGILLINGSVLPSKGLTVATLDPIYVKGNFNASGSALGTSDTSAAKPAALIGDSINVLSGSWNSANSTGTDFKNRVASDTTVNAAFLAGIVQTVKGQYSGGVENFPRFHEDWSGRTFTYNGSMVVMYNSLIGKRFWQGTGAPFYNPPNRNWTFDANFLDPNRLPPLCPSVRAVIRSQWSIVRAY